MECTKNHVKMINQKVFVYNIDWREQESCISNIDSLWKSKNVYNTCMYVSITQEYIMLYHWKTKHDYPVMNDYFHDYLVKFVLNYNKCVCFEVFSTLLNSKSCFPIVLFLNNQFIVFLFHFPFKRQCWVTYHFPSYRST